MPLLSLLGGAPMIGFRVDAFRHRSGLDYNPTVPGVVQLYRYFSACAYSLPLSTAKDKGRPEDGSGPRRTPRVNPWANSQLRRFLRRSPELRLQGRFLLRSPKQQMV